MRRKLFQLSATVQNVELCVKIKNNVSCSIHFSVGYMHQMRVRESMKHIMTWYVILILLIMITA